MWWSNIVPYICICVYDPDTSFHSQYTFYWAKYPRPTATVLCSKVYCRNMVGHILSKYFDLALVQYFHHFASLVGYQATLDRSDRAKERCVCVWCLLAFVFGVCWRLCLILVGICVWYLLALVFGTCLCLVLVGICVWYLLCISVWHLAFVFGTCWRLCLVLVVTGGTHTYAASLSL